MKAELGSNEAVSDDAAAAAYVETFAVKLFVQADNEDRSGKGTRCALVEDGQEGGRTDYVHMLQANGEEVPRCCQLP
jgi:hypothetical protein